MTELTARRECLARAVAPTLYPYPTSGFVLPSLGQRVTSPHVRSPEDSPCGLRRPSRRLSWPLLWGTLSPFNGLLIDHCQPARPGQMQKGPSGLPLGRSRCPHPPAVPWTGGEECGRSLEDTARAAVHQRGNGATGAPASGPSYAHRPGVLTRGGGRSEQSTSLQMLWSGTMLSDRGRRRPMGAGGTCQPGTFLLTATVLTEQHSWHPAAASERLTLPRSHAEAPPRLRTARTRGRLVKDAVLVSVLSKAPRPHPRPDPQPHG